MPSSGLKFSDDLTAKLAAKMGDINLKQKEQEAEAKAAGLGLPYINLYRFPITVDAITLIPKEESTRLQAVCFLYAGEEIRMGAVDPSLPEIPELLHVLEERHHAHGMLYLLSENSLKEAMKIYDALPSIKERPKDVVINEADLDRLSQAIGSFTELSKKIKEASTTDVLTMMLAAALKFNSSDVHVEAEEKRIVLRLRLDGILNEAADLSSDSWHKIISRIKLISGLKINIEDKPQDGRFTIAIKGQKIDVRVSTIPTSFGESVVMRILKPMANLNMEDLGFRGHAAEVLKGQVERSNGMIVTTGPTGSGKTTTLYSILQKLNQPDVKIITLEDPVEYKLPGINQSQIDPSRDYTFAKGLRSILRQDPDIVMVGEIRDLETAEVAIQAALTGHLMLSTIHTNSAAGAVPRFLSMGVKPFLLAPSLNVVIGQRLVRKLCEKCKKEITLDEKTMTRTKEVLEKLPEAEKKRVDLNNLKFYTGGGCEACGGLGYKGRMGIYEIFAMDA
ncbi:MAG: GspE/PulE family protein, partial [Patescibacteria group bacterium]